MTIPHKLRLSAIVSCALFVSGSMVEAQAQAKKPNILVIMGDDIGWYNTSITTAVTWVTKPLTSTASAKRAACFLLGTGSKAVPQAAQRS
jgi:uncharacterized membrane protein AbrB (regulator of aidB expression)